jgi:chemotaxis protein CheC
MPSASSDHTLDLLTPTEKDLLTELFNLGIGKAAKSLSILARQDVETAIPQIKLELSNTFCQQLQKIPMYCCVSQGVRGTFDANSMLFFPVEGSREIVRLMLNQDFSNETLIALHEDAITEIGNVIINACIGTISNYLKSSFEVDIPQVTTGNIDELLGNSKNNQDVIINIGIDLSLKKSDVHGHLLFVFGPLSIQKLKSSLHETLKKISPDLVENS